MLPQSKSAADKRPPRPERDDRDLALSRMKASVRMHNMAAVFDEAQRVAANIAMLPFC
jgi:hypothetical protein